MSDKIKDLIELAIVGFLGCALVVGLMVWGFYIATDVK